MPWNIRFIGKFGNGALAVLFGLMALVSFSEHPGVALFFAVFAALGAFNFYVLRKAARVIAEDEAIIAAEAAHAGESADSKAKSRTH